MPHNTGIDDTRDTKVKLGSAVKAMFIQNGSRLQMFLQPSHRSNSNRMWTSTTPSCEGPLRAQIFQKVCFYEQKYDFWPIRTRFDPFKRPPNSYFLIFFFKHKISFIYCHIEPTCQKFGTYGEKCDFWLIRAPFALFKSPPPSTHQKLTFSKIISSGLFCHTEPSYQKLCFYHQNCGF